MAYEKPKTMRNVPVINIAEYERQCRRADFYTALCCYLSLAGAVALVLGITASIFWG